MAERRPVRAVVDPSVLISAAISARGAPHELLVAWHLRDFEMVVSYDLLYELEAVLLRDKFRRKLAVSDVLEYVLWVRERATLAEVPEGLEVEVSPDPDDNYLLALVLASASNFLVSVDRHLLSLGSGGPYHVVSPQQFLRALRAVE